jgi:hypothetical protein
MIASIARTSRPQKAQSGSSGTGGRGSKDIKSRYTVIVKIIAFIAALTAFTMSLGIILYRHAGGGDDANALEQQDDRPPDAQLSQRLAIAYAALRDAAGTRRLPEAQHYAAVAVDAIAGPAGRHGRSVAPPGGIFPEDADQIESEPGLALRAYDSAPANSPIRTAVDQAVTGSVIAWRVPRERYDAIDRAVAEYGPDNDTVSALPGASERALAWALLAIDTDNIGDAHARAGRGAEAASQALNAIRIARSGGQ